jgi:hypothetical protein
MSDQPDSPPLELLRRMDAMCGRLAEATAELKQQVILLEGQYANIARRLGRVEERLERIERRLEDAA